MPVRAAERAAERFRIAFSASLACITEAGPRLTPKGKNLRELTLENAQIRTERPGALQITVRHVFTVRDDPERDDCKCHSRQYRYHLSRAGALLLRYEWHPGVGGMPLPHLHVHATDAAGRSLERLHLPTGRVSVEAFLRLLVREYDARWRFGRDHCERVLRRNEKLFEQFKTW